ncbi:MAG: DUF1269 domain-containing protein [Candidatus Limnocylindrales bacterium]
MIAFDHFDDARTAMAGLRALERSGQVRFEDTAIVERDPDGTAHVKNEISGTTETAAAIGAMIGGLVTFVFPLAGIALGAALGAFVGRVLDRGVSDAFVDEVKQTLRPGRSALFLVVKASNADATLAALRQFRGDVIQTTLDSEAEEALREALE